MKDNVIYFQYSIDINQAAAVINGLSDDLDIIDLAIFDFLFKFSQRRKIKKMYSGDEMYFSVHWKTILNEMPLLKIKTRAGIHKRIKKLKDVGILVFHEDNGNGGYAWYRFSEIAERLNFVSNDQLTTFAVNNGCNLQTKVSPPVNESLPVEPKPVNKSLHNNNTHNNNCIEKPRKKENKKASIKYLEDPETISFLQEKFPNVDILDEIETMKNWISANGKRYKNYRSFACNWIKKSLQFNPLPIATELNTPANLIDSELTEGQTHQYLEYLQHMKDKMPRVFNAVQILKASEYFAIRQGGDRWDRLRVEFTAKEIKRKVQEAHSEAKKKIHKKWDCPNIIELVNEKLKVQRYA